MDPLLPLIKQTSIFSSKTLFSCFSTVHLHLLVGLLQWSNLQNSSCHFLYFWGYNATCNFPKDHYPRLGHKKVLALRGGWQRKGGEEGRIQAPNCPEGKHWHSKVVSERGIRKKSLKPNLAGLYVLRKNIHAFATATNTWYIYLTFLFRKTKAYLKSSCTYSRNSKQFTYTGLSEVNWGTQKSEKSLYHFVRAHFCLWGLTVIGPDQKGLMKTAAGKVRVAWRNILWKRNAT